MKQYSKYSILTAIAILFSQRCQAQIEGPVPFFLEELLGISLAQIVYFVTTVIFVLLIYFAVRFVLDRQVRGKTDKGMIRSLLLFCIALIGAIAIVLALPMGTELKGQVTSLIGIVLAAALSLSSATFLGNAMAGIMIGMVKKFKPGDFIRINEIFGRVSEKGLFQTEIQTIDRDLITVPNLFLANNPVKVTRSSGTFISATCSLGYDVPRIKVEKCLIKAAEKAGLADPFMYIMELGDFSIVYKIHGLIKDVERVLSAKSKLYAMMLDELHNANIEIVSPNFMNQRQVGEAVFIPAKPKKHEIEEAKKLDNLKAEDLIFDKAEEAQSIEKRKEKIQEVSVKIKAITKEMSEAETDEAKESCRVRLEKWKDIKAKMENSIDEKVEQIVKNG